MKKLILAAAFLAGISTYATVNNAISPITSIHTVTVIDNEFQEISLDKLPVEVVKSLKESFPSATVNKAYVNEKEQYKLEISVEKKSKVVYTDKNGNWLDPKNVQ